MKKIGLILLVLLAAITFKYNVIDDIKCKSLEEEIVIIDGEEDESGENMAPSPLSGVYAPIDRVDRRPVAVMFDNHPKARWQAGLSQAEIIYEIPVEHPYTRYMGIYLINSPEELGPIRSSRPYFVTALLEYDPIYVRVGGSEEAKEDIEKFDVADIDGIMTSPEAFFRNTKIKKKSPHNLYTDMESIRKAQGEKNYNLKGNYEGFKFHEEDIEINGENGTQIQINYNKDNSTSYIYNKKGRAYERYKDGEHHIDEYNDTPIMAKNIIIQQVNTSTIDDEGRLKLDLIDRGKAIYISNGKFMKINWSKNSIEEKTRYYDGTGKDLLLNPGITWIQIVDKKTTDIIIE